MKDQEKIDRARGRGAGPRTISLFRRTKDVKTSLTTSLLRINRQPINGRRIDEEGEEVRLRHPRGITEGLEELIFVFRETLE